MNRAPERSIAVVTITIVAIIAGYLGVRAQLGAGHESLVSSSGQFTTREREEAFLSCLKVQAEGCYME
jgi:hypothetical protein